jgi:hypothetical protein
MHNGEEDAKRRNKQRNSQNKIDKNRRDSSAKKDVCLSKRKRDKKKVETKESSEQEALEDGTDDIDLFLASVRKKSTKKQRQETKTRNNEN